MTARYVFPHKACTLFCDPLLMDDGSYQSQVTITPGRGCLITEAQHFEALRQFRKEADAVEYAYDFGKRWVDQHC